jgi:hypothetical protein
MSLTLGGLALTVILMACDGSDPALSTAGYGDRLDEITGGYGGQALLTRVGRFTIGAELLGSTDYPTFEETLTGGTTVCADFQAELDATAARGLFVNTPWTPGELEDIADAVIGCDAIPDDLDPVVTR